MKVVDRSETLPPPTRNSLWKILCSTVAALGCLWSASASEAPPHNISAVNLNVVQNDTGNTADSVTVTPTLTINDLRVRVGSNRGDYNLQVGDSVSDDLAQGMPLVSISENGRDNGELGESQDNYAAPAFDGNANGYWAVVQDLTSDRAEVNINCAVAYFRYTNWLCGWARNATASNGGTNNLLTASPGIVLGQNLKWVKNGEFRVDLKSLGVDARNNPGVLLVNHAKNEGNFCLSRTNTDGTWEVYVKDNFGNTTSLEQDPLAFVFIPKTNTTVVSGRFGLDGTGTNTVVLTYSGDSQNFAISNIGVGRFRLTIPSGSPNAGVLMVSPEGGLTNNFDNAVSYEPDGDGWIIESRDVGTFPPPLESCTNETVASFLYIPAATAGFTITPSPTNTMVTSEFGISANFSVKLDLAPTNDVTVDVSSSNPLEGTVSTNLLAFNTTNWNIPQTVTITGQNDGIADGPQNYTIVLAPAVSTDTNYNLLDPMDVQVVNVDDELPGISVTPTNGIATTESGGTATFGIFLNQQPAGDVTIGLSSDNLAEGTVSPSSVTFNSADWNVPKFVTVTGADDFRFDGNQVFHIVTAPAVSTDPNYNGIDPADVTVMNTDNDVPAVIYNYAPLPLQVIEGQTTSYTVRLSTQPDSDVLIHVNSTDPTAGTVSPLTLTFTPADWSTPKVVTISGVDNLVPNDAVDFNVTNLLDTIDPVYTNFVGTWLFPAVLLDNESQILLSGDCIYGVGMPDIAVDGSAQLVDADATTYNNGSITFALTANAAPEDRLTIRNDGAGPNQISVTGNTVNFEGNPVGTFTGGNGSSPLVVSLGANSTLSAVQQLVRSVTFGTTTNNPSLATRSLAITLDDGTGANAVAGMSIRVGALRQLQYQEGTDHGYGVYTGANDIALSQVGHGTAYPQGRTKAPQEGLLIDWPDGGSVNESQVLLRFDDFVGTNTWQVPSNAIIVSAELLLHINNTGDGGRLYRMMIPWDATNATWDSVGGGFFPDGVSVRSVYESQLGVEDGSGATGVGMVSVGVTPDVQAWVNGETNNGWVMIGWPLRTDGTGFTPSEFETEADRPRLRVLWLVPGQPTEASFQQGENNYSNAFDTNLRQASPTVNYATEDTIWSDANDAAGTNNTQCLLRFDNIIGTDTNQIPPGAFIQSAVLELPSVGGDAMGDGGRIFAMLQPWVDTDVTWSTYGPNGIQPDGIVAATTPTVVAGNASLNPDVQGTINTYDVTADVQAWVSGSRQNYGWAILPWPGGSNGWGSRSSEWSNFVYPDDPNRQRPKLRVYYTLNGGVSNPIVKTVAVSPTQVQVPFTGTPGKTYTIMRASAPNGSWSPVGTATVGQDGTAIFSDTTPLAGQGYYRIVYP